jgi:cytochrome c biogenesis protein CcdA
VAHGRKLWLQSALSYTFAGCLAATAVGLVVGKAGSIIDIQAQHRIVFAFIGLLALVLATREWGWITFPLPQRKRQTEKVWADEYGFTVASAMWGFHIGLGFTTRITYGGFWILVAIMIAAAEPYYAVILMLSYWAGRILPVWFAPLLLGKAVNATELPEAIILARPVYRQIVGVALVWSAIISLLLAFGSRHELAVEIGRVGW